MYGVELYAAVRLAVVEEGLSHHEAGRRFGIDRRTVKKMLSYSAPPGYRRTTSMPYAIFRVSPSRPASTCRAGSPRPPWCAIASWTTRRRRSTPTRR